MKPGTLVLIPCRSLAFGKSRLSPVLDARERENLCRELLMNTLQLAGATVGRGNVRLVSADPAAEQIARGAGIDAINSEWPNLNAALTGARDEIVAGGHWHEAMVLPIDLPLADKSALERAIGEDANVAVAPDAKERGTNILVLRGEALKKFPFHFGERSFEVHSNEATRRGWSLSVCRIPELAFDIDEPEDYIEWTKLRSASRRMADAKTPLLK